MNDVYPDLTIRDSKPIKMCLGNKPLCCDACKRESNPQQGLRQCHRCGGMYCAEGNPNSGTCYVKAHTGCTPNTDFQRVKQSRDAQNAEDARKFRY